MGYEVSYNQHTKTVAVKLLNETNELTINARTTFFNQKELTMVAVPMLKNGAMFLKK